MTNAIGQCISSISKWNIPVDTGRTLIVHKTLRKRPGRLLNVLCTFSLRPVSMEIMNQLSKHEICVDFYFQFFFFHQMNRICLDLILGKRNGNCYTTEKLICLVSVKNSEETVWNSIEVVMHACLWAILIPHSISSNFYILKKLIFKIMNQNKYHKSKQIS